MNEMQNLEKQLFKMIYDDWVQHALFSWQWWLLLGLSIIPWIIWCKIVDKNRVFEILTQGFIVTVVATALDVFGWNRQLWTYPIQLIPQCTPLFPFDCTIIPVVHMLIYQYFRSWKSFLIAEIVTALCFAFGAENFLEWAGIYKMLRWKHLYSFPFYFGKAILGKWLIEKMKKPNAMER